MVSRSQVVRWMTLGCVVLLAGCHRPVRVATPPLPVPVVPAEPMPTSVPAPPKEAPAPTLSNKPPATEPVPTPAPATPAPRAARRPAATAPAAAPKAQPSLGNLSEGGASNGGDLSAQTQTLLLQIEQRMQGLSADVKRDKRQPLAQVQQFVQQARDALSHGDPAGANNLATKGKLLLDDTLK